MPVNVPQQVLNDYLMSRSVMDEPRSVTQRVLDAVFGRTYPEQATNALTGGVGVLKTESQFLPYMKGALDMLPLRLRALLERSPAEISVIAPNRAEQQLAWRPPATFWSTPGGGGEIVVDVEKLLSPEWFGSMVSPTLSRDQIIQAAIAHEGGHAANRLAYGNAGAPLQGTSFFDMPTHPEAQANMLRETLPVMIDESVMRRPFRMGEEMVSDNAVSVDDLWKALKSLEVMYSPTRPVGSYPVVGTRPPWPPSKSTQVQRAAMKRTAE